MAGHQLKNNQRGFTIVELLIVIVVIGILAAITIVSFNGISNRARIATVTSDLNAVSKKLKIDQAVNGSYPATLAATDSGKGVPGSTGTTYQYTVDNTANPQTFCLTALNGTNAYFITQAGNPTAGTCPGDSSTPGSGTPPNTGSGSGGSTTPPTPVAPTITNYQDFSTNSATNLVMSSFSGIPNGSWMIMDLNYTASGTLVVPSGWTALVNTDVTGTMRTSILAKIKDSSDTGTLYVDLGGDASSANGVIFWGTGAGAVSNWITGTIGKRNGTSAQQYITTTPTITTTTAQTLVLSISNERTTATETDISSLTGATKWFFDPQVGTSRIQTETVSYATVATPGVSTAVTVTYPNAQTANGIALQIGLPPS